MQLTSWSILLYYFITNYHAFIHFQINEYLIEFSSEICNANITFINSISDKVLNVKTNLWSWITGSDNILGIALLKHSWIKYYIVIVKNAFMIIFLNLKILRPHQGQIIRRLINCYRYLK